VEKYSTAGQATDGTVTVGMSFGAGGVVVCFAPLTQLIATFVPGVQ